MKSFTVTLTERDVYALIVRTGKYQAADGYWITLTPKGKVSTINHGADGGISFYDGNYKKITGEEAFKMLNS